ncbi:hypothetical protein [Streptomyces tauricus]
MNDNLPRLPNTGRRLTPEQAEALCRALKQAFEWIRRLREQMRAVALQIAENARALVRIATQLRPVLERPDRPAWQSPYGPALRRR